MKFNTHERISRHNNECMVDIKTTLWTSLLVEFKQLSLVHRNNNTSDENICALYNFIISTDCFLCCCSYTVNCEMRNMSAWLYGRASFTRARLAIHILFGTKHSLLLFDDVALFEVDIEQQQIIWENCIKTDRDSCRVRIVVLEQMNLILSQLSYPHSVAYDSL